MDYRVHTTQYTRYSIYYNVTIECTLHSTHDIVYTIMDYIVHTTQYTRYSIYYNGLYSTHYTVHTI